jgi:hypothetical protein
MIDDDVFSKLSTYNDLGMLIQIYCHSREAKVKDALWPLLLKEIELQNYKMDRELGQERSHHNVLSLIQNYEGGKDET